MVDGRAEEFVGEVAFVDFLDGEEFGGFVEGLNGEGFRVSHMVENKKLVKKGKETYFCFEGVLLEIAEHLCSELYFFHFAGNVLGGPVLGKLNPST